MEKEILLNVEHLVKYYGVASKKLGDPKRYVKAVDDVSFKLEKGHTLGVVGESGCGKSTLVNTILCLEKATSGKVEFDGKDLFAVKDKKTLNAIKKDIQIVFQDPFWSLNPRMLVRDIIAEPLLVHTTLREADLDQRVRELMEMVGLESKEIYLYPHEFSGGQRQRIAIARALALQPKMVVLDEPTSSIDILSQEQILKLLDELKDRFNLTFILISHDLSVVYKMSNTIAVMYLGKLVEYGDARRVFQDPQHPYTKALFGAVLRPGITSLDELQILEGNVPSAIAPPSGCRFHTRCPYATAQCAEQEPEMITHKERLIACHLYKAEA